MFQRRSGFSLVELVIVIVIIGIIAAIAIPRVGRGAKTAGESALAQNLAILRNAIELYASEHSGDYPGAKGDGVNAAETPEAFISQLTQYSSGAGVTQATRDATHPYGPYLRKGMPPAPVGVNKGSTDVLIDKVNTPPLVNTAGGEGWVFNPLTGDLIINSDENNDIGDKTYDAY
jgi:general secretion pathway protein G